MVSQVVRDARNHSGYAVAMCGGVRSREETRKSEPHVRVDFAASHALLLAKAIDAAIGAAIGVRPSTFTKTETNELFDIENMLVTAVDEANETSGDR